MIYRYQFFFIILLNCFGNVFALSAYMSSVGSFIWPVFVLGSVIGSVICYLCVTSLKRFGNIKNAFSAVFGKQLSNAVFIVYYLYFVFCAAMTVNMFSNVTYENTLYDLPLYFMIIAFCVVCSAASTASSTSLGRCAVIFGSICLAFFIIAAGIDFSTGNLTDLMPLYELDSEKTLKGTAFSVGIMSGESFAPIMLFGNTLNKKSISITTFLSVLAGNLLTSLVIISGITVSGQTTWLFPAAYAARPIVISFGKIMKNFGMVVLSAYFLCVVYKVTFLIHSSAKSISQFIPKYGNIISAIISGTLMLMITLSLSQGSMKSSEDYIKLYPYFSVVPTFILPTVMIILPKIKKLPK